ncbi:3-ketoacyl-ACP reductase [Clostridium sp. MCC353]|uniref:3-ketoacyl-ACP reductase n=1 Tax=Clostridium sp. MCC353 TaxID=2592646 RepID=UPI001C01D558|nr:3-ketoacyl-ACP reductase [Clostridium sp. MCC353]MBT9775186.1 3-ketoacyl-ACP reductase [Clostridium sp. MCC353]
MKRTAIVTGGSRGIGYAIAKQLGLDGCQVVVMATGEQKNYREALEHLTSLGIDWHYVRGSVDDRESRERVVKETVEHFGRIDILVNNAGVAPRERADLLEMTEESFDRVMGINAKGTLFLTQLAAKQMIGQEQVFANKGHIVNVGSCSAEVSSISRGEYCISKAAVSMMTTLFADRLASEGIVVNEVRPGVIATDMTSVVTEKYDRMIEDGVFPIARWGRPEDVADMVSLFCSDRVLYTTGNHVDVDGGFHIKRL